MKTLCHHRGLCGDITFQIDRNIGRVKHVGPPAPGRQISLPSNSDTLQPAASSLDLVTGLPPTMIRFRGEIASTLHPSVSYSCSGTSTSSTPRDVSNSNNGTGKRRR